MDEFRVILGEAVCSGAGLSARHDTGESYTILAIVRSGSDEDAVEIFVQNCERAGWDDPVARQVGPFVERGGVDYLIAAENDARETGYGWVVYKKVLH